MLPSARIRLIRLLAAAVLIVVAVPRAALAEPAARAEPAAPDPWAAEIEKFAEADRRTPPPEHPIVFVGSSSIRLWDLAKSFPELPAINRGFGGSTTADALRHVDALVLKYRPRAVVFYSGDNDLASGRSPEQAAADFDGFYRAVRRALPDTSVLWLPTKPSPHRWGLVEKQRDANARIVAARAGDRLFVPVETFTPLLGAYGRPRGELFQADHLHLNAAGYELWTSIVQPVLAKVLAEPAGEGKPAAPATP